MKQQVEQISKDKDVAAAVTFLNQNADLRAPQHQWLAFELVKMVGGSRLEPKIAGFLADAVGIWPNFYPMQSEIMQNATEPNTIRAAAENILAELAKRGRTGKYPLPAWAINTAIEALCLTGKPDHLALLSQINLPEGDESVAANMALASPLLSFLDNLSQSVARFENNLETKINCVLCVNKPVRQNVRLTQATHYIALSEIGLNQDSRIDTAIARIFLRAIALRIHGKAALRDDRALVTLQSNLTVRDLSSARLLALLHFHFARLRKGDWIRGMSFVRAVSGFPSAKLKESGIHVRAGNVELSAIECFLQDRSRALEDAERVVADLWAGQSNGAPAPVPNSMRLYGNKPYDAILRLCLQAGWYSTPGRAALDFEAWTNEYLAAFTRSNVIEGHNNNFLPVLPLGFPKVSNPKQFQESQFFKILDGRRIVMVSAFAKEIELFYKSGQLEDLWRYLGISTRIEDLKTIQSPFSIWPKYPNAGWSETFSGILRQAFDLMGQSGSDTFIAASGCYGAPLTGAIGKKFPKALALHYGHHVNTCFGVASGGTSLLRQYGHRDTAAPLIRSTLGNQYPNTLNRADLHRYT